MTRHITNVVTEQKNDGTWLTKFSCPICKWEKHLLSDKGININKGDERAFHSGSIGDLTITGAEINTGLWKQLWNEML